jgi:hypothetical protein
MNTTRKVCSYPSSLLSFNLLLGFGVFLTLALPVSAATRMIEFTGGGELEFECSNRFGASQATWSFSTFVPVTDYNLNVSFSTVDPNPVNFRKPNRDPINVDAGLPVRAITEFPQAFIWGTVTQRSPFLPVPIPTTIGSQSAPLPVNCTTDVR